jgi:yecA family protein
MKVKSQMKATWSDFKECASYDTPTDQLIRLDGFLREKCQPGGCNSLVMADGFLTAMLIGPQTIRRHRNQGLEVIWGDYTRTSNGSRLPSLDEEMTDILCERMSNIYYDLEHNRRGYFPMLKIPGTTSGLTVDKDSTPVIEWCRGFKSFFNFKPMAWKSLLMADRDCILMAPFIHFGEEPKAPWQDLVVDEFNNEMVLAELAAHLPQYIFGIKDFFEMPYFMEDMANNLVAYAKRKHR